MKTTKTKKEAPVVTLMPHIEVKHSRDILSEGRNYQMGFAFLKKVGDHYETVQPISPCKDYLNDVVYSEKTGKDCRAYGLDYKKQDIYDTDKAYIAINITHRKNSAPYFNYQRDVENLQSNLENLTRFINQIEEKMGVDGRTVFSRTDMDNLHLVELPLFWTNATYLISMWSLLVRVGQFYRGDKDFMEFLTTFKDFTDDVYILNSAMPKFKAMLGGNIPVQNMNHLRAGTHVHNEGIVETDLF